MLYSETFRVDTLNAYYVQCACVESWISFADSFNLLPLQNVNNCHSSKMQLQLTLLEIKGPWMTV